MTVPKIPTIVDIEICACSIAYRDSRLTADFRITSTVEFQRPIIYTLGFRCRTSEAHTRRSGDRYISGALLETYQSAQTRIPPFGITCVNLGDALMAVHVRMKGGMEACRVTILQDGKKPRINDDDFFKSEDIWYATAVIGRRQTIRVEELTGKEIHI